MATKTEKPESYADSKSPNPADSFYEQEFTPHKHDDLDEIAKHYDNETADPTQEERNIDTARKRLNARETAEGGDSGRSGNSFAYSAQGGNNPSPKQGAALSFLKRKRNLIALGTAGGMVGIVLAVFGLLSPLKLPSLLQAAADEAGQRVEQLTVHRAKKILARLILERFGVGGGVVITGKGPISSLAATLRENKFEERLAKKGLTIEPHPDGGVRLKYNGKLLEAGKAFKNEDAVMKALSADKLTAKMIDDLVKEDISVWRFLKRAKFAKWVRIKYDVRRYGVKNSEEKDSKKRIEEMQETRLTESYDRVAKNATDGIDCILADDNCILKDGEKNIQDSNARDVGRDLKSVGQETAKTAAKTPLNQLKVLNDLFHRILISKLGTKAIPIVGWIDLVATIDHIAYTALHDDYFAKIPAYFREKAVAQIYADWQGYSDQTKDGAMLTDFVGFLATQLDGSETTCAHNYIQNRQATGVCLDSDEKINSNNPSEIHKTWEKFKFIPGAPGNVVSHFILNVYYETVGGGGLLGWLGDKIGGVIAALVGAGISAVTPDEVEEWFYKAVISVFKSLLSLLGTADPLASGPKMYNYIHEGATASYNTYCKEELHCRKLTPAQAGAANSAMAAERAQDIAEKGWFAATFSPEVNTSMTTQLAIALPTGLAPNSFDLSSGLTQLARLVADAPAKVFGAVFGKVKADTYTYIDLYGVDPYGALPSDLAAPVAVQAITGDACPSVPEDDFDSCTADKSVAEAMICSFTPGDPDCNFLQTESETPTPSPSPGPSPVPAGSFGWPIDASDYRPLSNCWRKPGHTGIDIPVPEGTPVHAAQAGTVIRAQSHGTGDAGNYIMIKHADGHWTNYQHLSVVQVTENTPVQAGAVIGMSGNTGYSTGPHLHFSITTRQGLDSRKNVAYSINPLPFLPKDRSLGRCG